MASGDKYYLADKETLDEVKGKIGSTTDTGGSSTAGSVFAKLNYLVTQVSSYLSSIYTFVSRIGATNDAQSSSTTTGSVFAKLNYLVTQVSTYLSGVYTWVTHIGNANDTGGTATVGSVTAKLNKLLTDWTSTRAGKIDTIDTNLSTVNTEIGNTSDTGGTATVGTVMAKLNNLVASNKHMSFKHFAYGGGNYYVAANQTDFTLLSISGAGEFYGFYGKPKTLTVIADGVTYTTGGDTSGTDVYYFRPSVVGGLMSLATGTVYTGIINAMPFKQSLVVKITTGSVNSPAEASYALYE